MKKMTTLFKVVFAFILLVIFLMSTASSQVSHENLFRAPFISTGNSQHDLQSVIQNSEKNVVYIENLGQVRDSKGWKRPDVLFLTRSQGVDMYITKIGITYVFRKTEGDILSNDKTENIKTSIHRLDMEFVGANTNIKIRKELAVKQKFNYYTPEYPDGISPRSFKKVIIENLYQGIDLVYYEKEGKMKYDFVVGASANPNNIKMKYKGARNVYIDKDGSVIITTPMGEIREESPYTFLRNTGIEIESGYRISNNIVQFNIAQNNKSEEIVIDPYRIWATYYGGGGQDIGKGICTDNSNNIYVTGYTNSIDFPTQILPGAYNQTYSGGSRDVFILKFNSSGERIWATFYGGSGYNVGNSICIDDLGNLYITGMTSSNSFPTQTLPGAYNQNTSGGSYDAFVLKFNSNCERIWATYYGGNGGENSSGICTDDSCNLYITGYTSSDNFPTQTLPGAYNQSYGGGGDAFILKFNSNCERIWATYYGGSESESGISICSDFTDNLYLTGRTSSSDFPTQILTGGYNQNIYGGGYGANAGDAFVLKFNSNCERIWATYYGGNGEDYAYSICTDISDCLYVTGYTRSSNFPVQTLVGSYNQTSHGGHQYDAFILKFNSSCERIWATYYGGNGEDYGRSVCTDTTGNLYITGYTRGSGFPTKVLDSAYNQSTNSVDTLYDAFILKFNNSCERIWATYYGGNGDDYGNGNCTDILGYLYVTGSTWSPGFPILTLTGAYNDTIFGGPSGDAFILKFSLTPVGIKNISNEIPSKFSLYQNYPNPFNPLTNIKFDVHKSSYTRLIVYDMLGKEIATLVDEKLNLGSYEVNWDGVSYTSGVYFYKLVADDFFDVKKMLLIK